MQSEDLANQLREVPDIFFRVLRIEDDLTMRYRPAQGEWSAIEVLGHMIDKMSHWSKRVERILLEDRPMLPGYDQDAEVREHSYQYANPIALIERLQQQCDHFTVLVSSLPTSALQREGIHGEYGAMTLQQCIEAPLASVTEHLEQLKAAQDAFIAPS